MRALVVFESMFGNTQAIAEAVAAGLSSQLSVDAVEVGRASPALDEHVDLLVVGGPTHAFGMSRPRTRSSAAEQAETGLVSTGLGLREWLETLDCAGATIAAAFDTRVDKPRFPGAASHGAEKRLRRRGCTIAARGVSFFVEGVTGPLVAGEEDRARRWGESLAATVVGQRV
ncbi:MAG TPA: flavodoxin domain-containing protein [Jiangellaceae bacterium]|nr:flavodoxin domain-containing protein [Jiangellaceae bacterium]